jgi:hypothetical protein
MLGAAIFPAPSARVLEHAVEREELRDGDLAHCCPAAWLGVADLGVPSVKKPISSGAVTFRLDHVRLPGEGGVPRSDTQHFLTPRSRTIGSTGAAHLFEEPAALEQVAELAAGQVH